MLVKDGMSEVVLTVGPGHTLREAARLMAERKVGAAVVMDPDSPTPGIVTERDILESIGTGQDPEQERVQDHLTGELIVAVARLEPRAGRRDDGRERLPSPDRHRRRRAAGRPLDARHRSLLDPRRRLLAGHPLALAAAVDGGDWPPPDLLVPLGREAGDVVAHVADPALRPRSARISPPSATNHQDRIKPDQRDRDADRREERHQVGPGRWICSRAPSG